MRAGIYTILSAIQWASLSSGASSLIAAAVVLIIAAIFYALAGLKSQEFVGSEDLGWTRCSTDDRLIALDFWNWSPATFFGFGGIRTSIVLRGLKVWGK